MDPFRTPWPHGGGHVLGITRWTASAMSYTTLLMPLVTVALAAVLFDEVVSPLLVIGGAVTFYLESIRQAWEFILESGAGSREPEVPAPIP